VCGNADLPSSRDGLATALTVVSVPQFPGVCNKIGRSWAIARPLHKSDRDDIRRIPMTVEA